MSPVDKDTKEYSVRLRISRSWATRIFYAVAWVHVTALRPMFVPWPSTWNVLSIRREMHNDEPNSWDARCSWCELMHLCKNVSIIWKLHGLENSNGFRSYLRWASNGPKHVANRFKPCLSTWGNKKCIMKQRSQKKNTISWSLAWLPDFRFYRTHRNTFSVSSWHFINRSFSALCSNHKIKI